MIGKLIASSRIQECFEFFLKCLCCTSQVGNLWRQYFPWLLPATHSTTLFVASTEGVPTNSFFNSTKGSQAPPTLVYKALACKLPARLITKKSSTPEKDSQRFDVALKLANMLLALRPKDPSGLRQKASSINFWIVQKIACQSHAAGSSLQKKEKVIWTVESFLTLRLHVPVLFISFASN